MDTVVFLVEGTTEREFVEQLLLPHLMSLPNPVHCWAETLPTGSHRGRLFKGGIKSFESFRKFLRKKLFEDTRPELLFTTMFDLYGLPADFPCLDESKKERDPLKRALMIESHMTEAVGDPRFIPHLQVHEYEAMLFADREHELPALRKQFVNCERAIEKLAEEVKSFHTPEHINDGETTAPSKRIIAAVPTFAGRKVSVGPVVATAIGLPAIRAKCRHFHDWLCKLELLGSPSPNPKT